MKLKAFALVLLVAGFGASYAFAKGTPSHHGPTAAACQKAHKTTHAKMAHKRAAACAHTAVKAGKDSSSTTVGTTTDPATTTESTTTTSTTTEPTTTDDNQGDDNGQGDDQGDNGQGDDQGDNGQGDDQGDDDGQGGGDQSGGDQSDD